MGGRADHEPGVGEAGQPDKINHQIVARVVTGNMARQHPGIGRGGAGIDQC